VRAIIPPHLEPKIPEQSSETGIKFKFILFLLFGSIHFIDFAVCKERVSINQVDKITPQESAILELTNEERTKAGLQPLKANPRLMQAARDYSFQMAQAGKLTHSLHGKSFADRIKKSGYAYRRAGENVARSKDCFPHVMGLWMKSHGHRNNILNPEFEEMGIGIYATQHGDRYFTQLFGGQR